MGKRTHKTRMWISSKNYKRKDSFLEPPEKSTQQFYFGETQFGLLIPRTVLRLCCVKPLLLWSFFNQSNRQLCILQLTWSVGQNLSSWREAEENAYSSEISLGPWLKPWRASPRDGRVGPDQTASLELSVSCPHPNFSHFCFSEFTLFSKLSLSGPSSFPSAARHVNNAS